jgi:alpha-1,2-glucosyltransferase
MAYASDCRALITKAWKREARDLSPSVMHTAFNIALFPPLFFFSGLFYTDVLSTCMVLRMYRLSLQRKGSVWLYVAGILALTMRQTNIFWVAVFLGGLEVVRAIKTIEAVQVKESPEPKTWRESAVSEFQRYGRGEMHDVPLRDAEIQGTHTLFLAKTQILIVARLHIVRY